MKALGFPFDRGRFDESDHPFTEGVPGDIRVATKFALKDPFQGLLGALHETGQALYDLGLPSEWVDQPVGQDRGMAMEESQSLLLEMMVGRSRAFVTYLRPLLEKHYGAAGPEWTEENLYRYLNRVARGPNRMDADELTYQTHIWMRYELERRLLSGELAVKDLREAWNALSSDRLGLVPASDLEGCLQDIHWAIGLVRPFPFVWRRAPSSPASSGRRSASSCRASRTRSPPASSADCSHGCASACMRWARASACRSWCSTRPAARCLPRRFLRYLERKYLAET